MVGGTPSIGTTARNFRQKFTRYRIRFQILKNNNPASDELGGRAGLLHLCRRPAATMSAQ